MTVGEFIGLAGETSAQLALAQQGPECHRERQGERAGDVNRHLLAGETPWLEMAEPLLMDGIELAGALDAREPLVESGEELGFAANDGKAVAPHRIGQGDGRRDDVLQAEAVDGREPGETGYDGAIGLAVGELSEGVGVGGADKSRQWNPVGQGVVPAGTADGDDEGCLGQLGQRRDARIAASCEECHLEADERNRIFRVDHAALGLREKGMNGEVAGQEAVGNLGGGTEDAWITDVHLAGDCVEDFDRETRQLLVLVEVGGGVIVRGATDQEGWRTRRYLGRRGASAAGKPARTPAREHANAVHAIRRIGKIRTDLARGSVGGCNGTATLERGHRTKFGGRTQQARFFHCQRSERPA